MTPLDMVKSQRSLPVRVGARRLGVRLGEEAWTIVAGFEDEKGPMLKDLSRESRQT